MERESAREISGEDAPLPALPKTERLAPDSESIHHFSSDQLLDRFEEDALSVPAALRQARSEIRALGEAMSRSLGAGGRVVYVGAGTSGRLGVLDAAEWPPTFGIAPGRVIGIIAGGESALRDSVEAAEDRGDEAVRDLQLLDLSPPDLLVGISASGLAAYVLAALELARQRHVDRAFLTCVEPRGTNASDPGLLRVILDTGPEIVAGSTRLKAATATHQALQRASNLCAFFSGWIYAGRMVEMRPTNAKLWRRAIRIVTELGRVDDLRAEELLDEAGGDIKLALVMARTGASVPEAKARLDGVNRFLPEIPEFA